MEKLEDYLKKTRKEAEDFLEKLLLPPHIIKPPCLADAMKYSVLGNAKRIRAILCITIGRIFKGDDKNIFPFASALEFIHAYSLVHDDLPGIDNDDYRRGQLSTHKKFGEAMGILAGDALLTHAFWIIASQTKDKDVVSSLVETLAWSAGVGGMVIGQVADVLAERKWTPAQLLGEGKNASDLLDFIHNNKTAALICASCVGGAIAARASQEAMQKISQYGQKIGLAFQVMDDILDVTGCKEKMGKAVNKDQEHGKLTYPGLYGLTESQKRAQKLINEACDAIRTIPENGRLLELAAFIIARDH